MKDIKQITIKEFDERFYEYEGVYKPSVTFIQTVGLPTSPHLVKWIADLGYEEAEEQKKKAGDEGSEAHDAIDRMLKGEKINSTHLNLKVKRCIQAFLDWYKAEQPEILCHEYIIWAEDYAGTVDLKCRLKSDNYKKTWLIDYKTSKSIHDSHKSQVIAYLKADHEATHGAVLHLGNTTKKRYTFSPIEDVDYYWQIFCSAKRMFQLMKPNAKPTIEAYPEYFELPIINN